MKIHRFFVEQNLNVGQIILVDRELIHQIKDVLKLHLGEKVILFNGDGFDYEGIIERLDKVNLSIQITDKKKNQVSAKNRVVLYCAILKKENFEMVAQKATEVGVAEITPLITERTVKLKINKERLKKIVKESTEQCGRNSLPLVNESVDLKQALQQLSKNSINFYFDTLGQEEKPANLQNQDINIFVGPEGGWSDQERALFQEYKVKPATLGKSVLRGETAAIIASYLMAN